MTSKERAVLKKQAMQLDSIYQIGKSSLTPQMVNAIRDALKARELIKVSVLKNCLDDPREIAAVLSERTGSEVVQVIGKKIVLYKKNMELEEKRKRAAKRKAKIAKGAARQGSAAGIAKGTARRGSGTAGMAKSTARRGDGTEGMAKSTARRSSGAKGMAKSMSRPGSSQAEKARSAGSRGRRSTGGKPMKWSDR
ncbi:MAG: YhbY family RNA-binding protein [Lachnospiraceae bacterium]|nr:YhbY family RNA-binding protein [Lachnospiraceae bacterium]